jgi:flagellar biosynthesis protein FlhG
VVAAWRKYFGLEMDYLGGIDHDDEMWRAVRVRRPLLIDRPDAAASLAFEQITDRLLAAEQPGRIADQA